MRVSPISFGGLNALSAFSPLSSSKSRGAESVRNSPVDAVAPIRPLANALNTESPDSLLMKSGKFAGSTMRRALWAAWQRQGSSPAIIGSFSRPTSAR